MWFGNETAGLLCNNHVGSHCVITVSMLEVFLHGDVDHLGLTQLLSQRVEVERKKKKKNLNLRSKRWKGNRPRGRERCVCSMIRGYTHGFGMCMKVALTLCSHH